MSICITIISTRNFAKIYAKLDNNHVNMIVLHIVSVVVVSMFVMLSVNEENKSFV